MGNDVEQGAELCLSKGLMYLSSDVCLSRLVAQRMGSIYPFLVRKNLVDGVEVGAVGKDVKRIEDFREKILETFPGVQTALHGRTRGEDYYPRWWSLHWWMIKIATWKIRPTEEVLKMEATYVNIHYPEAEISKEKIIAMKDQVGDKYVCIENHDGPEIDGKSQLDLALDMFEFFYKNGMKSGFTLDPVHIVNSVEWQFIDENHRAEYAMDFMEYAVSRYLKIRDKYPDQKAPILVLHLACGQLGQNRDSFDFENWSDEQIGRLVEISREANVIVFENQPDKYRKMFWQTEKETSEVIRRTKKVFMRLFNANLWLKRLHVGSLNFS